MFSLVIFFYSPCHKNFLINIQTIGIINIGVDVDHDDDDEYTLLMTLHQAQVFLIMTLRLFEMCLRT